MKHYTMNSKELGKLTYFLFKQGVQQESMLIGNYEEKYNAYVWEAPTKVTYRGPINVLDNATDLVCNNTTYRIVCNMLRVTYNSAHIRGAVDFDVSKFDFKYKDGVLTLHDDKHFLQIVMQ